MPLARDPTPLLEDWQPMSDSEGTMQSQERTSRRGEHGQAPGATSSAPADPAPTAVAATPVERVRIALPSIVIFAVVFWLMPLVGLWFAQYIDILLVVFLAVLFSTFLTPVVNLLERLHIHRGIGIVLIYLFVLGVLYGVVSLALPLFTSETQTLLNDLPGYLHSVAGPLSKFGIKLPAGGVKNINLQSLLSNFSSGGHQVGAVAGQAVGLVFTVGQLLVFLLAVLVMAFFLTVRKTFTADLVNALAPPAYRPRTISILNQMGQRMGHWVLGQIVITIYYAVAFSLGLTILQIPFALSVGVITGLLEIIPFVGGFVGLLLAALVALSISPISVIWVILLYLIVTNVEAHILVPLVYGRAVKVHPVLVIISLLVGAKAFSLLGALIAVPLAAALQVIVEHLYIKDVVESAEQQRRNAITIPPIDLRRLRPRRRRHDRLET